MTLKIEDLTELVTRQQVELQTLKRELQQLKYPQPNMNVNKKQATSRRHLLKHALVATAGLVATSVPALTANAESDLTTVSPQAGTPGTVYVQYPGTDFWPVSPNSQYARYNFNGVYVTVNPFYFYANLYLPQKAVISEVLFYTLHNTATTTGFYLDIANPSDGSSLQYATANLSSANISSTIQTVSLTLSPPLVVDNATNSYSLLWQPTAASTSEVLLGVRVGYVGGVGRFKA